MTVDFFVPLVTYPEPTAEEGLVRLVDLAATIGGRLSIEVREAVIPPVSNVLAEALLKVSQLSREIEARSRATGDTLEAAITRLAERRGIGTRIARIRSRTDAPLADTARAARYHDASLMILTEGALEQAALAEAILFGSGGPIIVIPAAQDVPSHLDVVAVAWDGSRAAARALRDALPVLALARSVQVVAIEDDKPIDRKGTAAVRSLLEFHGIAAAELQASRTGRPVGVALQDAALDAGAGLLVMGGFGHNRLREFVLGGATRSALAAPRLPIFMSH